MADQPGRFVIYMETGPQGITARIIRLDTTTGDTWVYIRNKENTPDKWELVEEPEAPEGDA